MKQVLLIGSGGSGKSTLARLLAVKTGLPLIHLDALYWRSGWKETPKPEWESTVDRLTQESEWIMDGNDDTTLDLGLVACDTVILLDISPWRCLWRIIKRRLTHAGQSRPGMASDCPERLDLKFLWRVASYRTQPLPSILMKLKVLERSGKKIVVLCNPSEVKRFLSEAPPPNNSFKRQASASTAHLGE